jgi:iron(III) transport system permease protein
VSLNGFWTPQVNWGGLSLEPIQRALLETSTVREALTNSLTLGVIGATIGMSAAAIVSLYLIRVRSNLGRVMDGAIKLPATLSPIVVAVGFVLVLAGPPFNLGGTVLILLLAYLALYYPQGAVAADGAVAQVSSDLVEASQVSGVKQARTFRKIYVPLMLPGLIAGWALLFVRMISDLSASAILAGTGNRVVGREILEIFENGSYAQLASLALAVTLISAVVVVLFMYVSNRSARWSTTVE